MAIIHQCGEHYNQSNGNHERKAIWVLLIFLVLIGLLIRLARPHPADDVRAATETDLARPGFGSGFPPTAAWYPLLLPRQAMNLPPPSQQFAQFSEPSCQNAKYIIWGKVISRERLPLFDVTVSLYATLDEMWRGKTLIGRASTDASGSYELILESPPKGHLLVNKAGYEELVSGSAYSDCCCFRRDFVLVESAAAVTGRVADEDGNPIAGALVYVSLGNTKGSQTYNFMHSLVSAYTDSQGFYEVEVAPDGDRVVVASHEEYRERSMQLPITEGKRYTVDFNLPKVNARIITARVVDAGGSPILGARLDGTEWKTMQMLTLPDDDGFFKVRLNMDEMTQPSECIISARNYLTRTVVLDPGQPRLDIVLEKAKTITGTVLGPAGQPLPGTEVYFRDTGYAKTVKTDESGFFSVPVTDPPAKYFQFSKPGYAFLDLTLDPGFLIEPLTIILEFAEEPADSGGGVYGMVFDSWGLPSYAFTIHILPDDYRDIGLRYRNFISIQGNFKIDNLPEGIYTLSARRQGDWSTSTPENGRQIEIRRDILQGPIFLQLEKPETIK
jgi:hypothetical protein